MKKIIVAVDGLSSCGKSTMARQLAGSVAYTYIDSGAMYRAVTLYALRNGFLRNGAADTEQLHAAINRLEITFLKHPQTGETETWLNGENVETGIRRMEVAAWVSQVAAIGFVRRALVVRQQELGREKGVVMDGRDIGTVVFPHAELKIFVTASAEVRARRRADELLAKGQAVSIEEVLANVRQRDLIDMTRRDSPLRRADDALELDNTFLTPEEQQNWLMAQFRRVTSES